MLACHVIKSAQKYSLSVYGTLPRSEIRKIFKPLTKVEGLNRCEAHFYNDDNNHEWFHLYSEVEKSDEEVNDDVMHCRQILADVFTREAISEYFNEEEPCGDHAIFYFGSSTGRPLTDFEHSQLVSTIILIANRKRKDLFCRKEYLKKAKGEIPSLERLRELSRKYNIDGGNYILMIKDDRAQDEHFKKKLEPFSHNEVMKAVFEAIFREICKDTAAAMNINYMEMKYYSENLQLKVGNETSKYLSLANQWQVNAATSMQIFSMDKQVQQVFSLLDSCSFSDTDEKGRHLRGRFRSVLDVVNFKYKLQILSVIGVNTKNLKDIKQKSRIAVYADVYRRDLREIARKAQR